MTGSRPADIVRRYFDAWASQDRATVERMAADGFHFTSQVHAVEVYFGWDLPHRAPLGGFVQKS